LRLKDKLELKSKTLRTLAIYQFVVILLLFSLTLGNEILDVPHYFFKSAPTSFTQRYHEIIIEFLIFFIVIAIQFFLVMKLYRRIRLLEGFIPICATCKKIRNKEDQWDQMEKYLTEHSLAQFSHSICPECLEKYYPEEYESLVSEGKIRKMHHIGTDTR
jgi:hypothetical protein